MNLELERLLDDGHGTLGILRGARRELPLWTVEPPWRGNEPFRSCVPPGFYDLVPLESPSFGATWSLRGWLVSVEPEQGVPRSQIRLHAANRPHELEGCIAPGLDGAYHGGARVGGSIEAMDHMLRTFGRRPGTLLILPPRRP